MGRQATSEPQLVTDVDLPQPYDADSVLGFLRPRVVKGIERLDGRSYTRTVRLPAGPARIELDLGEATVAVRLWLSDPADQPAAMLRVRWSLDLDTDVAAVDAHLARDPRLAGSVAAHPGLRVPGHLDGFEVAVRAIVGQQISVAGARTIVGRIVDAYGEDLPCCIGGDDTAPDRLFPRPEVLADVDPGEFPMPRARGRALVAVAEAVASGAVVLERGVDRAVTRRELLALPGIGPWTADYIALRALGDPDVFLPGDLGVRHGLARMGLGQSAEEIARSWSPWRSYALMHVWQQLSAGPA